MLYSELRVAALAVKSLRQDCEHNYSIIEEMIRRAAKYGANLVCTPEGALQGYDIPHEEEREKFIELSEPLDGIYIRRFSNLAIELNLYIALGFSEKSTDKIFNSVVLIDPTGERVGVYRKSHLGEDEALFYSKGDELPVFETDFGPIGIITCFDRQFPETARLLALKGARLILNASAGGYGEWNRAMVRTRAYENKLFYLFAHPLECFVVDPFGEIIAQKGANEDFLVRRIDLAFVDKLRGPECADYMDIPELYGRWRNQFKSRRPELYREISEDS